MKQIAKRLLSMALVLVMVLSMLPAVALPAAAASGSSGTLTNDYGFEITVPDGFNSDTTHPYGNGATTVNLSPVKEIGVFESSANTWHSRVYNFTESTMVGTDPNKNLFSSSSQSWIQDNVVFPVQSHFFHPSTAMTTQVMAASSPLESASGTSLDASGTGRDNVLAYYGRNRTSGRLQLYIYPADRANHDTVTGAAWTGSAESSYSWMSETTAYNNEGYLSIVSGDFDGDGKDTMVLYDPAAGNLQLREFEVTDEINGRASQVVSYALGSRPFLAAKFGGSTLNRIQKLSGNTAKARNTAMVHLAVGDVDRDYKDELIVTVSLTNMLDETGWVVERSSVLMVLDKNPSDKYFTCTWVQQLNYVYDSDKKNTVGTTQCWFMRAASSAVGDIDGDGFPEILTVGVGSNDNGDDDDFCTDGYFAVITEFTGKPGESGKYSIETATSSSGWSKAIKGYYIPKNSNNDDWVGTDSKDLLCMSPVSLGLVRFDGTGTVPYVVIRGTIFKYQDDGFTAAKTNKNGLDDMLKGVTIIRQPIVGNFDGNIEGREQIFFAMSYKLSSIFYNVVGGWYYDGSGSVMNGSGLRSSRWQAAVANVSEVVLTAPDADTNDGYIAKYKNKEYTCVDPEIMAILEAAPYFEDLKDEYRETLGGTTFGTGKGSGSGSNVQGSTRAGAYISYEQDISIFGIKIGSIEAEAASMLEWSWGVEKETEFTYDMEFDGGRDSNQVVLICTPVTIYHYEAYDVETKTWKPMDITLADQPVYTMISVEEYNAVAKLQGDPVIGSDIISSVPGQPKTYRTSTSGLKNVYSANQNQWMDVGHGSSTITQSITKTSSSTFSNDLVHSIDVKAGIGAGGFVVGLQGGVSIGGGWSKTNTSSLTRSGTVGQVPDGYNDYSFRWKFITWDATIGTGDRKYTVPVLGYVVTGVKQPPSMPQNVEIDPGTDSVTLTWESGFNSAAYYEVCRYVPNDPTGKYYYVRGEVSGSDAVDGEYTFTDTGLQPGTQYQYTLRAVSLESTGAELYSNYTEPMSIVTASTAGTPKIVSQTTGVVNIVPGASTTFQVIATPAISSNSLTYQWQSRSAGETAWKNMTDKEQYKLTVTGSAALNGTSYRCMVVELTSGTLPVFIYSEPVTLKVGKADTTATLSVLDKNSKPTTSGSANHSEEEEGTPYVQTVVERYEIKVGTSDTAITYEAYAAGNDTYVYRNVADGKYYRLNGLSVAESGETGVYTGTATSATELTALTGYLADGSTDGSKIIAKISDLRGTVQETAAFDADGKGVSADAEGAVLYNVFTATGVAVQGDNPDLQQSTLTLYQQADNTAENYDPGYYVAFYETQADETQVLKLYSTTALTEIEGSSYPSDPATGETTYINFTYLKDTLQPSWTTETQSITIGSESKECEVCTDGSVTVYKYTEYEDITFPVYDENDVQTGEETVKVVKSETYYYGITTVEGEGEGQTTTTTYTALSTFEQGLYGVIGAGNTVSGTVTPGAVKMTTVSVPTTVMKQVGGDPVTLKVALSATRASTSGTVTFQITNTTTGLTTTRTASVSNGTASVTWTPSTEGVYTIRAVYGGSTTASAAASNTITYYATAGSDALYDIRLPAAPQYGDAITPSLYQGTTAETMQPVTGVVFTYHEYLGTGVSGTDNKGYKTVGTTIPEGGISSLLPGAYLIKATVGDEVKATKILSVSKRAVTVTLPNFTVSTNEVRTIDWAKRLETLLVTNSDGTPCTLDAAYGTAADGYSSLFTLGGNSLTATAGSYDVVVGYKNDTIQADFLSKYMPTLNRCVATVTTGSYTVTYAAGANGTLTANNISDGSQGFATGASIKKNSALLFLAAPDAGFQVSKWTVKNATTGAVLTAGFTVGTNTLTLNALSCDLVVTVEFSNETHLVTFGTDTTAGGKVAATQLGTTLVSGNTVVGGSSVTFTAAPAGGYVVKQWSVAKNNGTAVVQQNPDGTAYTGTTLTLDNIDADTAVTVTFEAAGTPFQVTYSAVKNESGSLVAADDVVTFTADGLENGTAAKGSTVKLTATLTPGTAIQEWQIKDGTTWKTVAGSVKEYTIYSLQANTQIRVLVTTSAASYPVTFNMVDGNGAAASNAGTLTAAYNGGNISSGTNCMAYTTVVFTYTESENYELVRWVVTGTTGTEATDASNRKVHTYTIDSLAAGTEVKAVVQKKPQITITQPTNGTGTIIVTGTIEGVANQNIRNGKWVDCGTTITVTVEPTDNYVVTGITAKTVSDSVAASNTSNAGTKASGVQTLTFSPTENVTISATFEEKPTVSIGSGITNGMVTFTGKKNGQDVTETSTDQHVDFGSTVTITATPDNGYVVGTIDGADVNTGRANGSITVENVVVPENGKIVTATFLAKPVVTISNSEPGKGDVAFKATKDGSEQTLSANSYVDFGTSLTVTLKPSTGYEVGSIAGQSPVYTDAAHSDEKSYTISNVQADQTITADWAALPQYSVTYSVVDTGSGANGTLTASVNRKGLEAYKVDAFPGTDGKVYRDSSVTFTAVPANGYRVMEWKVDGNVYQPDNTPYIGTTLTLSDIAEVKTVTVQFMEVGSKVTVAAGANGTITSAMVGGLEQADNIASGFTLSEGAAVVITARPDVGYEVAGWSVNGVEQPNSSSNTFTYTAQTEGVGAAITVTFRQVEYPVTWSGVNGTVTADGYEGASADIRGGSSVIFTAAPSEGYVLAGWTVNGVTQSGQTGGTFTWTVPNGMAADPQVSSYEVGAVFERGKYTVTVTQPVGGAITSDATDLTAVTGDTQVIFTAVPNDGFILIGWTVDGVTTNTRNLTHTVTVTKPVTVTAILVPSHYVVNCAAGGEATGSTVTVSGSEETSANVAYGENITFTAIPAPYYHIRGWMVDGEAVPNTANRNTFTLSNVTGTHTVTAVFEGAIRYEVRYASGENGSLSATNNGEALTLTPGQTANVWGGSRLVFTATPAIGATNYMVAQWTVNGTQVTGENMADLGVALDHYLSNTLTVESLSKAMTIQVSFTELKLFEIPGNGAGYTVTVDTRNPKTPGDDTKIRKNGDVTFTVAPVLGKELTALTIGDVNCLTEPTTGNVTAVKNDNGSYTITVKNVTAPLNPTITAGDKPYTITIMQPIGGTLTVVKKADGRPVTTGESITFGTELTVTAVPNSDFVMGTLTVGGAAFTNSSTTFTLTGDVTIAATFEHLVIFEANGGSVSPISAVTENNKLIVLPTPVRSGYTFIGWYTTAYGGLRVTSNTVFATNTTIYAHWLAVITPPSGGGDIGGSVSKNVIINNTEHGSVTATPKSAEPGQLVTLTVAPDKGYELGSLTAIDSRGNSLMLTKLGSTDFTFVMPDREVQVRANFVKTVCDGGVNCPAYHFTDVDTGEWYHEAIDYVIVNDLMNGEGDDIFAPLTNLNRGMMVTILYRLEGEPAVSGTSVFSDVAADEWYTDAVVWAAANGIVNGYGDGTFGPLDDITREQMVVILYRYSNYKGYDVSSDGILIGFADSTDTSDWAEAAMKWAVGTGLIQGKGNDVLDPLGTAIRAEVAQIFMNFCKKLATAGASGAL